MKKFVACLLALINGSFAWHYNGSFQENGGIWSVGGSSTAVRRIQCGTTGDIPVPADYFNDGEKRLAVFRPGNGVWYIKGAGYDDWRASSGNIAIQCGMRGDVPVAGDYEGDGVISIAVWRPSNGNWYIKGPGNNNWGSSSGNLAIQCGMRGDVPVPMDYFNERRLRMAVWRPSNGMWYIKGAGYSNWAHTEGNLAIQCGMAGDIPVPGDYFGDGIVRLAVWRPSNGNWYIKGAGFWEDDWWSTEGNVAVQCGTRGDIPVPYDFFGEGKLRMAVYRPSNGVWYIKGNGFADWGANKKGNVMMRGPAPSVEQTPVNMHIYT